MEIRNYLSGGCPEVTADTRVDDVYEAVNKRKCAVVFDENGSVLGVLGAADMLKCTGGRIGHCHVEKPRINADRSVFEAIDLMSQEATDMLLVFDNDVFLGVVSIYELAQQLYETASV